MSLSQLLIVLTLNAQGLPAVSFAQAANSERCARRQALVVNLLRGSGVTVIDSRCIASERRFTRYGHDADGPQAHWWLLDLQQHPPLLQPARDAVDCRRQRSATGRDTALCAVTRQRELGWWERILGWIGRG